MTRKTVVLCEGVHDLALLSSLLQRKGRSCWQKKWDDIQKYSRNTPEATVISEFKSRRGTGVSFLLKQDQNVTCCIESFWQLYMTGYEGYDLKLVIDSDGDRSIRALRDNMIETLRKDVLLKDEEKENIFYFKGGGSERTHAVFLYPKVDSQRTGKLTDIIREAGCGNLEGSRDEEARQRIITQYLDTQPSWITDLEAFLEI